LYCSNKIQFSFGNNSCYFKIVNCSSSRHGTTHTVIIFVEKLWIIVSRFIARLIRCKFDTSQNRILFVGTTYKLVLLKSRHIGSAMNRSAMNRLAMDPLFVLEIQIWILKPNNWKNTVHRMCHWFEILKFCWEFVG
jgi:hypothetical protein